MSDHSRFSFSFESNVGYIVLLVTFVLAGKILLTHSWAEAGWIQPCLSLLCFIVPCRSCIFTNWRFLVTLPQASHLAPFSQYCLLTSHLCVTFCNSSSISNIFISIPFAMVLCDLFDVTITIVLDNCFECNELHNNKTWSLMINTAWDLTTPLTDHFTSLLPLPRAPLLTTHSRHSHIFLPFLRPPSSLRHSSVKILAN